MKPSQCEACRAVGPTVMCNLCPTGPRRSVQPPATPQEPDPQKNLAVLTLRAQQAERAYDRLNLCSDHRDKATGRCIVCDGEERSRRASAPPAVWQDIETACETALRLDLPTRELVARIRSLRPSPPTPGGK